MPDRTRSPAVVRVLMGKELRQLLRSRGAIASALFLPGTLLLAVPTALVGAVRTVPALAEPLPIAHLPPVVAEVSRDPRALLLLAMPILVAMSGIVLPAVTASYTMIIERESRTLELLAALPVRVGQVLFAKLAVVVLAAGAATVAMLAWQSWVLLAQGLAPPRFVAALFALLFAALAYSASIALLASLLARDFRTANNVNGALLGPSIATSLAVLLAIQGSTLRVFVLASLFALAALVAAAVALRVVTFERLLR